MLSPVPTEAKANDIVFGHDLLAYSTGDGGPRVVFRDRDRVFLDRLQRDWISIEFPPVPRWQLSGNWYSMPATDDPASIGVVACTSPCSTPTTLFGELNVPALAIEVNYNGRWEPFPVGGRGFLIELPGFHGVPDGYRWRDERGTVWASGRVDALAY